MTIVPSARIPLESHMISILFITSISLVVFEFKVPEMYAEELKRYGKK